MTLDKAITDLETEYKSDFNLQLATWLKDYKRLLESCEYAVSCEDVIKAIQRHAKRYSLAKESEYMGVVEWSDHLISVLDITKTIKALPPVQPKPKIGQWVLLDECSNSGYYCSECHKKLVKEGWSNTVKKIKYCPNCGAKMINVPDINDGKLSEIPTGLESEGKE